MTFARTTVPDPAPPGRLSDDLAGRATPGAQGLAGALGMAPNPECHRQGQGG